MSSRPTIKNNDNNNNKQKSTMQLAFLDRFFFCARKKKSETILHQLIKLCNTEDDLSQSEQWTVR